jgi:hypothetical protein
MADHAVRFAINVWPAGPDHLRQQRTESGRGLETPSGKDFKVELV